MNILKQIIEEVEGEESVKSAFKEIYRDLSRQIEHESIILKKSIKNDERRLQYDLRLMFGYVFSREQLTKTYEELFGESIQTEG